MSELSFEQMLEESLKTIRTGEVVTQIHFFPFNLLLFEPKQIDGHHRRRSQHSISKHIHNDMRGKPRALQSRHQRLIMNLRFEDIDTNKDQ